MSSIEDIKRKLPRGVRNNNFGNIRKSADEWQGKSGDDGEFTVFDTPQYGVRAAAKNFMAYTNKHGLTTIREMINRWAPPNENATDSYVDFVATSLQVNPDEFYDVNDPDKLKPFLRAVFRKENGGIVDEYLTDDIVNEGVQAAFGNFVLTSKKTDGISYETTHGKMPEQPNVIKDIGKPVEQRALGLLKEGEGRSLDTNYSWTDGFYKQKGHKEYDGAEGFFAKTKESIKYHWDTSPIGLAMRTSESDTETNGTLFDDMFTLPSNVKYTLSDQEVAYASDKVTNPNMLMSVLRSKPENLDEAIRIANENEKLRQEAMGSGFGADVIGGLIGAGGDPFSFLPVLGVAGKAASVGKYASVAVQSGALNVASDANREYLMGDHNDPVSSFLGGALFGAGMSAIADAGRFVMAKGSREGVYGDNGFENTTRRLEEREMARLENKEDPTRIEWKPEDKPSGSHAGVEYKELPHEDGAVALRSGIVLSDTNPANPKLQKEFAEIDPERIAAKSIDLGSFSAIGTKMLSSKFTEIRDIAYNLFRSETGMQSGSHGKHGATASDIFNMQHSRDLMAYKEYDRLLNDAINDLKVQNEAVARGLSKEDIEWNLQRKVAHLIEHGEEVAGTPTKAEAALAKHLKEHYEAKAELLNNPAQLGNKDATPIMGSDKYKGSYVPRAYDKLRKRDTLRRFNDDSNVFQRAAADSLLASYDKRPKVKAQVDEYLKELHGTDKVTKEMVDELAMKNAYGITRSDEFTLTSMIEDHIDGINSLDNNSFLKSRILFDTDIPVMAPDGAPFAVDDIRVFDLKHLTPAYDRRVNGDIAIMVGTGKSTKELKDAVVALRGKAETSGDGKLLDEVGMLEGGLNMLTGRARRKDQDSVFNYLLKSLSDLAFMTKNAYMFPQNFLEIGGMIGKGNYKAMLSDFPIIGRLADHGRTLPKEELKAWERDFFGLELDQTVMPTSMDYVQRLRENTGASASVANIAGTIRGTTQRLSAAMPFTKALNGTTNYITSCARRGLLGDIVDHTLAGTKSMFAMDNYLKSASITPEQFAGIQKLIKDTIKRDPKTGQFTIVNKDRLMNDPAAMDLWRLADKAAFETIMRTHTIDMQMAKAQSPMVQLATQFKTFTMRSLNSRFMRDFHEATKNDRVIDKAISTIFGLSAAGAFHMARVHIVSLGMGDEEAKRYKEMALDPRTVVYAMISRAPNIGSIFSMLNFVMAPLGFDQAAMVRTTIPARAPVDKEQRASKGRATRSDIVQDFGSRVLEQVPAANYAANMFVGAHNLWGYYNADTIQEKRKYNTALMHNALQMFPNDPVTQGIILNMYRESDTGVQDRD